MKRFNINEFIWFLILSLFTLYIYFLISSGKITLFLHPKMVKYAAFSFIVFGELAVVQLFKVFTVATRVRFKKGYLLFFITLIIGVFIAPGGLTSQIGEKKGVILVSSSHIESIAEHSHNEKQRIEGNEIIFNEKNYIHYLEDLSDHIDEHIGKKIRITGFVLKDNKLSKNEFLVSRMLINCCAADSQILGVVGSYDKSEALEKDSWIVVEGKVSLKEEKDINNKVIKKYPVILVEKLINIEKPNNPYIYE
ncbi:TIGR03943 family protein [Clostridium swellfunianum]|uniref:TIGR03943 family putative permease subunit n=1 Tax=Clostridium swellfunianum TaxID=1367462 RepID=UPI0020300E04|nr:TIGR03943 family protein [Clostridium swellfunianum]MCM0649326.1 TIGR03943 family protein [Clostridium swellfunianum]